MSIVIYTQPMCPFCDLMKDMLDETGFTYYTVNIKENAEALQLMKTNGHRTVPQLYVGDRHINKKTNTRDYTSEELGKLIQEAIDNPWPWSDSGVEHGI